MLVLNSGYATLIRYIFKVEVPLPLRFDYVYNRNILTQNMGTLPPVQTLCDLVISCWQNLSLQETSLPCLPTGLNQRERQMLQGPVCLQINNIINAGESAYSQYQRIKKLDSNLEIDFQGDRMKWEPSPKRMLILELTDGYQVIQAMEYQSIPCFNVSTVAGSKVRLRGNIPCRRGMLLLTAENVEFIGGSVENLVTENRQDKVLARALCIDCPQEENAVHDGIAGTSDFHDGDFGDLLDDLNDDDLAEVDLEQYH
ncbi:recQ-mediated genome instability protein 1-like [Corticium candelabrum]|uniref:recQ-mediated genome instability protein 1-like n=1 Tax=Corticium candelabrum TaxID=121492 RepID=UPI002E26CEFB|nr:recQ-mediated genome instability protein 1-like [Corticium candelabrum]